jgi:hypothetical protein
MRNIFVRLVGCSVTVTGIAVAQEPPSETIPPPVVEPASPPPPAPPPPPAGSPPPVATQPAPPPPPGPAPPPVVWVPPPPQAVVDPTARRHDGFYLRMSLGIGYGRAEATGTLGGADTSTTYSGLGPAFALLIGGTVGHAVVIGGGFVGQDVSDPEVTFEMEGVEPFGDSFRAEGALGVGVLGPFVDWFPDEHEGFHFGGMVGLSLIGLRDDRDNFSRGFAGSLWAGYDFWIADQWSLGAELRGVWGQGSRDFTRFDGSLDDRASSYEVLFTALYH